MHARSARLRISATALVVVVAGFGLTSCSALFPPSAPPPVDSTTGQKIDVNNTDVFSVKVGDCFNDVSGTTVSEVPIINCANEHDYEVFAEYTMTGSSYPGDTAVDTISHDKCVERFKDFVGIAYEDSSLEVATLTPTSESWSNGDRIVSCMISNPDVKTSGSLRNKRI